MSFSKQHRHSLFHYWQGISLLVVSYLIGFHPYCRGQQIAKSGAVGIRFIPGTFQQALQSTQAQKKPLCIEVYLAGCPHCEALTSILAEKPVGDFFNTHFVNWKIEANHPDSKVLQQKLGITYPEFPLLLFVDSDGSLQHMATPAEQPSRPAFIEEVIRHGQIALDEKTRSSSYTQRFITGERDLGFLIQAGKYWKAIRDTTRLQALNGAFAQQLTRPEEIVSSVGLYVLNRFIDDFRHPLAQYFVQYLPQFKARFPLKEVREAGESMLYHSIYGTPGMTLTAADVDQIRVTMTELGIEPAQASARTFVPKLEALMRTGQTTAALEWVASYCRDVPRLEAGYYVFFMRFFNQKAVDLSYLAQMPQWAAAGLSQLKGEQPNPILEATIYYELALAQQKAGQRQEAMGNARKGLERAKAANATDRDLSPYHQLLTQLGEK